MATIKLWYIECASCAKLHLLGTLLDDAGNEDEDAATFCLSPTNTILCGCGCVIKSEPDAATPSGWASYVWMRKDEADAEMKRFIGRIALN